MRVGIVCGGTSTEAEASRKNALSIEQALKSRGHDTCILEYGRDMAASLRSNGIDMVYVCVQGKHHGDGTLQAILDHERIPYTGSAAAEAALINNKIWCKLLFDYYGVPTPKWRILHRNAYCQKDVLLDIVRQVGCPFVAKAPTQGGSFGIELIKEPGELHKLDGIFQYDDPILLEEFIDGDFYTVGLFDRGNGVETLKCVEGVAAHDPGELILFTGEYGIRETTLAKDVTAEMESLARKIFEFTNARDVARVDFMVPKDAAKPYAIEINAVPGLKRGSLMPREAEYSGIKYEDLIEGILLSAWNRGGRRDV